MALLAAADRAEFGFVRDHVEVSDSVLSKQMSALEDSGYVKVHKGYVDNRPRTWLSLTKQGRQKFARHLAALREIAAGNGDQQPSHIFRASGATGALRHSYRSTVGSKGAESPPRP